VAEAVETGAQQNVPLREPVPVYLVYMTATANEAGEIVYADDVYRRDAGVIAALDAPDIALARRGAAAPVRCAAEPSMP
jgi:L,D-transpeptidase YcbB